MVFRFGAQTAFHFISFSSCERVQGYVNGSAATRSVLGVANRCSQDVDCLFPEGASGRDHRWDQSVFTSLLHLAGLHTHTGLRFWAKLCNANMREHISNPLTAAAPRDALIMTRNRYVGIYPYAEWAADGEQWERQRLHRKLQKQNKL